MAEWVEGAGIQFFALDPCFGFPQGGVPRRGDIVYFRFPQQILTKRQTPINFGTDNTGFMPSCALTSFSDNWRKSLFELADKMEGDTGSIVLLMEND